MINKPRLILELLNRQDDTKWILDTELDALSGGVLGSLSIVTHHLEALERGGLIERHDSCASRINEAGMKLMLEPECMTGPDGLTVTVLSDEKHYPERGDLPADGQEVWIYRRNPSEFRVMRYSGGIWSLKEYRSETWVECSAPMFWMIQ